MYDNDPTMMGHSQQPSASLIVRQGPQAGMSFPLTGAYIVAGREEGVDIILQDPEASRRHARISWQEDHFIIEDLGSTNGTFVNGVQVTTPRILNPGDSIGIGQTALVFQTSEAPMGSQSPAQQQAGGYSPQQESNKTLQYALYGCGCLLFICICALLSLVAFAFIDPELFQEITGFDTGLSLHLLPGYLQLV